MIENSFFKPVRIILETIIVGLFLLKLYLGNLQPC